VHFIYSFNFKSIFKSQRHTRFESLKNISLPDSISFVLWEWGVFWVAFPYLNACLHASFSLMFVSQMISMYVVISHMYLFLVFSLRRGWDALEIHQSFFQASLKCKSNSVSYDLILRDIIKLTAPLTSWWHRASYRSRTRRQRWLWPFSQKLWIFFQEFRKLTNIERNASSFWWEYIYVGQLFWREVRGRILNPCYI